jgi:hypothetical protein
MAIAASVAATDQEPALQGDQAARDARARLRLCADRDRARLSGNSGGRGYLLRMVAAPGECHRRPYRLDGLPRQDAPTAIRIFHHKTGAVVLHPLEDNDGTPFYADAESVLGQVPRRGVPMILHETRAKVEDGKPRPTKVYAMSSVQHLVQRLRKLAKCPRRSRSMPAGMAA